MAARVMAARVMAARVMAARVITARVMVARVMAARVMAARVMAADSCRLYTFSMVKMSSGLLSLKWNHHRSTFLHVLANIRQKESYSDVTLACAGKFYPTHKLVLSTCSEYFEEMFERTQCKHPVIVLKDIGADDLEALLCYMYDGEVNVLQENLSSLIKAAECLKIKGLAVADNDPNERTKEKKLLSSSSSSGNNINNSNNRDVQRNDRRPVNSNGSGIKRSNVNSSGTEDSTQPTKRRKPEARLQPSTSTSSEEREALPQNDDMEPETEAADAVAADGGGSDKADDETPVDMQGVAEHSEDSSAFIQGLNAEAGVKAEPVEVLDDLGFDDRDDSEDAGVGAGQTTGDLSDFTEEKFAGGDGDDPSLWSGGEASDIFSQQPSTSNFGKDEPNNDHGGGGGKSGNTSSSVSVHFLT
ncbi:BTB/POZ domain [Trinorchestia longiramus]|nr:BTB/POZ domain [Trinorchestia longiramus]